MFMLGQQLMTLTLTSMSSRPLPHCWCGRPAGPVGATSVRGNTFPSLLHMCALTMVRPSCTETKGRDGRLVNTTCTTSLYVLDFRLVCYKYDQGHNVFTGQNTLCFSAPSVPSLPHVAPLALINNASKLPECILTISPTNTQTHTVNNDFFALFQTLHILQHRKCL